MSEEILGMEELLEEDIADEILDTEGSKNIKSGTVRFKELEKIKRIKKLADVLMKYGFEEILSRSELEKRLPKRIVGRNRGKIKDIKSRTIYERVRMALEEMGPAYVKFGQMLSNRNDILPEEMISELQKLQDKVEIQEVDIRKKLAEELNIIPEEYFQSIDEEPMASASIGQVFRAVLKNGEKVVLKVRRDNIDNVVETDLIIMKDMAKFLEKYDVNAKNINLLYIVETFENMLKKELSLTNERKNMERFENNFKGNEHLHVPVVYKELSNNRILCMEFIEGIKITDKEKIEKMGFNPKEIASLGLELYIKQVMKYGFFHADPHPGNIFLGKDGKLIFIDFGAMGTLYPYEIELLEELTLNFLQKDVKKMIATIKELALDYNISDEKRLERGFYDILSMVDGTSLEEINLVEIMERVKTLLSQNQVLLSEDMYLLVKGIGQIEGIGRHLNPQLNIMQEIGNNAQEIMVKRMSPKYILEKGMGKVGEFSENWLTLPSDLKRLLEKIQNNELKHRHELVGFENFQKITERLVLGLVVSSLIIGSSILVLANMPPHINGISVLGILGFIISGILGANMIMSKKKDKY
ncbi:ABC1 family protein [Leptotrichia sp. oral taxon 215 str. W9775]|uniref:ABC1 kinase family protein n=1 Tax=Leptotrichia sp. oral taxon 215 TaxID=712359 RepID=UPI0003AE0344|nr:AarF/UbiB family protein [Leptotrichia sp. oral taxon 215]ERK66206.1 ABC1 family protein [Leptotrichia sp. oral taxon 215 str. W9775]